VKRKGVGTRAIQLLLAHAFDEMGMEAVTANSVLRNVRSQHIIQKLGFVFTHEDEKFKHYRIERGSYYAR